MYIYISPGNKEGAGGSTSEGSKQKCPGTGDIDGAQGRNKGIRKTGRRERGERGKVRASGGRERERDVNS